MTTHGNPETTATTKKPTAIKRLGTFSHELTSEITINAPVNTVWAVLTDLDRYHEWNPFVIEAAGSVDEGSKLSVRIQPVDGRASGFSPTVTAAVPGQVFEWLGRTLLPGVFDGRHRFDLEPTDDGAGTRFRQSERFNGLLVPFLRKMLDNGALGGFVLMNQQLKARAETMAESAAEVVSEER